MKSAFKKQIKRDLETVFFNADEHADKVKVLYNNKNYKIPVVFDSEEARERKKLSNDNAEGVFVSAMTVYISFADLGILPRKETNITISGEEYRIIKASFDAGQITLDLEVFDE